MAASLKLRGRSAGGDVIGTRLTHTPKMAVDLPSRPRQRVSPLTSLVPLSTHFVLIGQRLYHRDLLSLPVALIAASVPSVYALGDAQQGTCSHQHCLVHSTVPSSYPFVSNSLVASRFPTLFASYLCSYYYQPHLTFSVSLSVASKTR